MNIENKEYALGIYDISADEYNYLDAIRSSGINYFLKFTPKHFYEKYVRKTIIDNEESYSLFFGTAFHTYILEPEKFEHQYILEPKIDKRLKKGKEEYNQFLIDAAGKKLITNDDLEIIKRMAESVYEHKAAAKLIQNARFEKSIFWVDNDSKLPCKCRPDILHPNMIVDLKSTLSASERAFQNSINKYGYHIQAAMYLDGVASISNESHTNFIYIAVEKKAPWLTAVYALDDFSIERGRDEYKEALLKIKKCMEENEWTGYGHEVLGISLPSYIT